MMPAEIPGFYFDPEKGKYFRIQANHVAPTDSKYSKQAVKAERKLSKEQIRAEKQRNVVERNRITQPPYLQHPLLGLPLQRQLGDLKMSSTRITQNGWAATLHERTVFRNLQSDVFAVEPESKQLFGLSSPRGGRGREFCVSKHSVVEVDDSEHEGEGGAVEKTTYTKGFTIPIYDTSQELGCVEPINKDLVVWVTREVEAGTEYDIEGVAGSRVHFSRRRGSEWGWLAEEYGEWGTSVMNSGGMIRDLKASEGGRKLVLAEDAALLICDIERGIQEVSWGVEKIEQDNWRREWMCVSWKGENVVMGGDRGGEVWLADIRVDGGTVMRARCPWAVSAVRSVGKEGMLVWGLAGGRVFDLRYNQNERANKMRSKKITKPAVVFDVPESRTQKRYGMGWDYDEHLGLVVSAGTDLHKRNRVSLWDVNTGRMVDGGALGKKDFPAEVTCMRMVDLEERGGIKSLLVGCNGRIKAWEV